MPKIDGVYRPNKYCPDCGERLKHYCSTRCRSCEAKRRHHLEGGCWYDMEVWNKNKKCPQLSKENHHMWGKHHTEESKRKISNTKGKTTYLSINNLKLLRRLISFRGKYKKWRKEVFNIYNGECGVCLSNIKIHIHHKIPFSYLLEIFEIKTVEEALNNPCLWDLNNGIALCEECHKEVHYK